MEKNSATAAGEKENTPSDDELEEHRLQLSDSKHRQAMYLASCPEYSTLSPKRKKKKKGIKKSRDPRRYSQRYEELSKPRVLPSVEEEKTKTVTTQATFERLLENSIGKARRVDCQVNKFVQKEKESFGASSPKSNRQSHDLASKKVLKHLDKLLGDFDEGKTFTEAELLAKLRDIGLLGKGQKLESVPLLKEKSNEWEVPNSESEVRYDCHKFKESLTESVAAQSPSQFDFLVRIGLMEATEKSGPKSPEESEKGRTRVSLESLERLSQPRYKTKKHPWTRKRDPIYFGYREPPPPMKMSPESLKILTKIEEAKMPFVERDQYMTEKRKDDMERAVRQQIEEVRRLAMTAHSTSNPFRLSTEAKHDSQVESKQDSATASPIDQGRKKIPIHAKVEHPAGWDTNVSRLRMAYARRTHQTIG